MDKADSRDDQPIQLAERRIASPAFAALFREGMRLVEEAAAYLDGEGRKASRDLTRGALAAYAQQSMRLSTRLMQLASWLLLQRAVAEGEISVETALRERLKIDLRGTPADAAQEALLPDEMIALIGRSYDLQRQIAQFDAAIRGGENAQPNAVASHLGLLRSAFERH
ncbi:DUF1465 family protein [Ancylobacter sp. WKF20]|uniref:DUF1465 family protein n=1 Tax=Ancylobacter sp. WKF20 TaxID=3039801 RepID=UPI0024343795|nr:DUF1465 family protein [Ancylobacter sp. WKF20]WGD28704.1 DUF1465 family protein [Ancylobacter sp. WKF20]